jgi:hypothetical protein
MATFAPIDVAAVVLATSDTIVGTVPTGKSWAVARVSFCNTTGASKFITIATTTGASIVDGETEIKLLEIQPNATYDYGPAYLPAGRKIIAKADAAASVTARIHGLEKTP